MNEILKKIARPLRKILEGAAMVVWTPVIFTSIYSFKISTDLYYFVKPLNSLSAEEISEINQRAKETEE